MEPMLEEGEKNSTSFDSFELDPRLIKALQRNNILQPTPIQMRAIPLALAGKDILAKARTGSGKTLAYLLPILHRLLTTTISGGDAGQGPALTSACRCLILVPTKELARQVSDTVCGLLHYGPKTSLRPINLATEESFSLQQGQLCTQSTVVVSTPARLLPHLEAGSLCLLPGTLEFLVIDEADLVLSFGYSAELQRLVSVFLPKTAQTFLMSATLTVEVEQLKALVLRSPVILKLTDGDDDAGGSDTQRLQQYVIRVPSDEDKFLLMYVALKLKLLKGKLLIFVNDVERCFRLKLFLEQFGIKTCLLNPELPLASRHHIVDEFNRGVYDIVVASDQRPSVTGKEKSKGSKSKRDKLAKEGGVARGVDFRHVDVVINFDLPLHTDSYVHRVGRTARGSASGTAISFVIDDEKSSPSPKTRVGGHTSELAVLQAIMADQEARGHLLQPHSFDLRQLDGFRYRCGDALRSVTPNSVRTARLQMVKEEIIRCERLKEFWEERPKDLALLRHDGGLGVIRARPHLKHVPEYLLEPTKDQGGEGGTVANSTRARKLTPLPQPSPHPRGGNHAPGIRNKRRNPRKGGNRNVLKRVKK